MPWHTVPTASLLASAGFDDKIRIYTSDGRLPREFDAPGSDMKALTFSPDGTQLATAGRSGTIRIWNVKTGCEGNRYSSICAKNFRTGLFAQRSAIGRGGRRSSNSPFRRSLRQSRRSIARAACENQGIEFLRRKTAGLRRHRTTWFVCGIFRPMRNKINWSDIPAPSTR